MKRGGPLRRVTPLRGDPAKVREFGQRGRGRLERVALARTQGFRRASSAEGPLTPAQWRKQVFDLSGGVCQISGARARDVDDPSFQAHHILPKRVLRERQWHGLVWDPRNALWLSADAHERLEHRAVSLSAQRLPVGVWAFLRELDALEGTEWATVRVLRDYPPAGCSRISQQEVCDGSGREWGRPQGA